MKIIGFVDYFIDEWHSNNYIGWINDLCKKNGYDFQVKYAWAETETYEGKISTDEWCAKNGVEKCSSIEEVCEKSDYIFVLAPGNPEKHLPYAETVLKFGKNTYIDKTFTPCKADAEKIYEIAEKYNTKFFSTSALRYATELDDFKNGVNSVSITGGGGSFQEYIVHQIEMLVKLMGTNAEEVKVFNAGKQNMCVVKFSYGRCGFLEYASSNPFSIAVEEKNGDTFTKNIDSEFFIGMLDSILNFFLNGNLPFEKEQTLAVIGIRDALIKAIDTPDEWVKVK